MDWDQIKAKPEKEYKVVGTQLIELKGKMDQDHEENEHLKTKVEKLDVEKESLDEKLVSEKNKSSELETKVKELENALLDRYKEISSIKDEKSEVKKDLDVLTKEHQIVVEVANKSERIIKEHEIREEKLENDIKKLEASCNEKDQRTGELRGEIEGIKAALMATGDMKDKEIKQVYSERDTMRSEFEGKIHDLNDVINDLEAEKTRLASQLKAEKEMVTKKESAIKAADGEKSALRGTIDGLKKQLKEKEVIIEAKDFDYFKNLRKEKASKVDKSSE